MGANPSIHRGQLTLEGVVNNNMDRQLAYMAANRVFGAFSVTNNLRLENDENLPKDSVRIITEDNSMELTFHPVVLHRDCPN